MLAHRVRSLLPLALLGLVVTIIFCRARKVQAEQTRPYGCYSAQQVIQMAERLCSALAPQEGGLRLSLDRDTSLTYRAFRRHWGVDCIDKAGVPVFEFDWDAEDGELLHVFRLLRSPHSGEHAVLSRREAVQAAWGWMRILGMAAQAPQWRAIPGPQSSGDVWLVHLQAKDRAAAVNIDCRSGELLIAKCWRTNADKSRTGRK